MYWVNWRKVCSSKDLGCLGIKDLETFNNALLYKWMWRFLVDNNSTWARTIRERAKVYKDILLSPSTSLGGRMLARYVVQGIAKTSSGVILKER